MVEFRANQLECFAETFELPIALNRTVQILTKEDGRFIVDINRGTMTADQVVLATGPFQKPYVPEVASRLEPDIFQTHSTGYRKPSDALRERSSSSVAETRGSKSPKSSRGRTVLSSRSARARLRCRSASSAAISSGG
jgi:hypothetical protein